MSGTSATAVRVGGQALPDGVLMRTPRAWAIARDDGTTVVGRLSPTPADGLPVVRVLVRLGSALRLGVARGMLRRGGPRGSPRRAEWASRRANARFLAALVAGEAATLAFALAVGARSLPGWVSVLCAVAPWVVTLGVFRLITPAALWRYHGAEHKAVAALEAGVDMADVALVLTCSRVHDRCGTNLVFVMAPASVALLGLPAAVQVPALLVLLAAAAELVSAAASRPRALPSRVVLAGGRCLQRWVTTAEPTREEQAVTCAALVACLAEDATVASAARFAEDGDEALFACSAPAPVS